MRKRTQSRELALQFLYQLDVTQSQWKEAVADFWEAQDGRLLPEKGPPVPAEGRKDADVREYTERLVAGVQEKRESIDATIERFAEHWNVRRMAYVDRNILRLATYEMLHLEEIPVKVAINEAVELAKRYGESDSSKFVNGILDKIAKTECKE